MLTERTSTILRLASAGEFTTLSVLLENLVKMYPDLFKLVEEFRVTSDPQEKYAQLYFIAQIVEGLSPKSALVPPALGYTNIEQLTNQLILVSNDPSNTEKAFEIALVTLEILVLTSTASLSAEAIVEEMVGLIDIESALLWREFFWKKLFATELESALNFFSEWQLCIDTLLGAHAFFPHADIVQLLTPKKSGEKQKPN